MAKQGHFGEHWTDEGDNPAGGVSSGRGFAISWQNGPLGRDNDRKEPNGAFVEDIIEAVIGRIEFYQASKFKSEFNRDALVSLEDALTSLRSRTADREQREVEGTHAT